MDTVCPRCAKLEQEIVSLRQRLDALGVDARDEERLDENDRERELARWLSIRPRREVDAAAGNRAGWASLARHAKMRFREWERLWWQASAEQAHLRARVGVLLAEISRLSDSG